MEIYVGTYVPDGSSGGGEGIRGIGGEGIRVIRGGGLGGIGWKHYWQREGVDFYNDDDEQQPQQQSP